MADFSVTRDNVVDYAELVVRDYLQAKGYLTALESLNEDVSAAKSERRRKLAEAAENVGGSSVADESDSDASVTAWYIVNQHVGLPTLLNENRVESE